MISCTKLKAYGICVLVIIAMLIFLNIEIYSVSTLNNTKPEKIVSNEVQTKELTEKIDKEKTIEANGWSIEVSKINLKADIAEGTSEEVMNKYVGHFENTEIWQGNVGLAAHNRRLSCELFWKN